MIDDLELDRFLKVHTTGVDSTDSNYINYPYEPTPYSVLDRLANSGYIGKKNYLLDYGCGKGRVDFYLSFQVGCHSIGIEYNERIYNKAIENKNNALSKYKVEFINADAEDYIVPINIDRVYYFNPFCLDIMKSTIKRLKDSMRESYRKILLFFYFPSEKYEEYLNNTNDLTKIDEIDCKDLFDNNPREKIIVYELK